FGNRIYLVETDNIYSTIISDLISEHSKQNEIEIVAVKSVSAEALYKEEKMKAIIKDMTEKHPDVVVNLLSGDENIMLFRSMHALLPSELGIKTISFNLDENIISHLGSKPFDGTYVVSNFFENQNLTFSNKVKEGTYEYKTYLKDVSSPFINGYNSVYIWKNAVEKARSFDPQKILSVLPSIKFNTPSGSVAFNQLHRYISAPIHIGNVKKNGEIEVLWTSSQLIKADPFPSFLTKDDWTKKINNYYLDWNSNWSSTERH
ncbi:MAG: transporter substrate-binding protein, partial [Oligoflexia bacterium]|nr:transporter substrate-binding protein [Oligoflexia bacterium]